MARTAAGAREGARTLPRQRGRRAAWPQALPFTTGTDARQPRAPSAQSDALRAHGWRVASKQDRDPERSAGRSLRGWRALRAAGSQDVRGFAGRDEPRVGAPLAL